MAAADYYLCDICASKTFYDADLNYRQDKETGEWSLPYVGDMAVICDECAITHEVIVRKKERLNER